MYIHVYCIFIYCKSYIFSVFSPRPKHVSALRMQVCPLPISLPFPVFSIFHGINQIFLPVNSPLAGDVEYCKVSAFNRTADTVPPKTKAKMNIL